ncbi:hypothetical protein WAK64_20620 [Bacillus spongiae]|uniref:Uncharacterized protein n=1 Tax=Bacillus spongiae TaxID=2683610 RepID=A0ABU8HJQ1_9BACI
MAVYQLPYDEELDKDIHNWLQTLPRNRKAEMVRNAIRFYLQANKGGNMYTVNPVEFYNVNTEEKVEETKKERKAPNIPTNGNFE